MTAIALPARAKLNLDLHVLGKMPDGFHELDTTMQAIDLHDMLEITPAEQTKLTTTGIQLSDETENSVLKAQRELEIAADRKLAAHLHLHKRIPPGSGMGGASSDAASALRGLKLIFGLDIDLQPVAERVGADVPFFLYGGRMQAKGRGEHLTPQPVQPAWFAIAWPGIELSTAAVYRAWDQMTHSSGANLLTEAAFRVDSRVKDFATRLGPGWQMTGSGSAFFKKCKSEVDARQIAANLDSWTAVTHAIGPWA